MINTSWRFVITMLVVHSLTSIGLSFESSLGQNDRLPLTETEVDEVASKFLAAITERNQAGLNALIDWNAILERAMRQTDAPIIGKKFRDGFLASQESDQGLAGELIHLIDSGGSYQVLNVRVERGYGRVLFRVLLPDGGGFNYHDFALAKQADGEVRVIDIQIYLSGESYSETIRWAYLPAAKSEDRQLASRLSVREKQLLEHAQQITSMSAALNDGDFQKVIDEFDELPKSLRQEKHLLIQRLVAAQNLDKEKYATAIDEFAQLHPRDVCMNMMSIDAFVSQGRYADAIKAIERIQDRVGKDPFLQLVKSRVYEEQNDDATAKQLAEQAIRQDESLLDGYWILLNLSLKANDFRETLQLLKRIDAKFSIELNDLRTLPQYKSFVESSYYQQWLTHRQARTRQRIKE